MPVPASAPASAITDTGRMCPESRAPSGPLSATSAAGARNTTPASSGDRPRTCWRYSVDTNTVTA